MADQLLDAIFEPIATGVHCYVICPVCRSRHGIVGPNASPHDAICATCGRVFRVDRQHHDDTAPFE